MSLIVPWVDDWPYYAVGLLPGVASRGWSGDGFVAGVDPLGQVYDDLGVIASGIATIGDASGYVLDIAGDLVGEARQGLGDAEYRRIIAGARVAQAMGTNKSIPRIKAGWAALTSGEVVSCATAEPLSVHMSAQIGWIPTSLYLARAGAVVRRMVAGGFAIEAVLYAPGTAIYDDGSVGYDIGTYAYQLRT